MRIAWPVLLLAAKAAAQDPPPMPTWEIEVDATDDFDNVQRTAGGTVHTHHVGHFTLVLETECPKVIDDHLRISTLHPVVRSFSGEITGGREAVTPTSEAIADYTGTLLRERVSLSLAYDGPQGWAGQFALGLATKGTNTACVVHPRGTKTCAGAEVAPLAPFGWTFDSRRGGGTITRDGDTWLFHYTSDDPRAPGETHHHRELTLKMRPLENPPPPALTPSATRR